MEHGTPGRQGGLFDPQHGATTSDTGRATAEAIINANPTSDALTIVGGGDVLVSALASIESLGLTGKMDVVSTGFLPDLDQQFASGAMSAESGGHYADPLFAFMMVYNAIKGLRPMDSSKSSSRTSMLLRRKITRRMPSCLLTSCHTARTS